MILHLPTGAHSRNLALSSFDMSLCDVCAALLVHETMRVKQLSLGLTGPEAREDDDNDQSSERTEERGGGPKN